ncbi:FxSxx-COOH cyclophane-containing RiPP peptide [Micromonospora purpureochromogenes]|uniref:FxSxx-COOH cyclophane-containing RiPP peptide n=1 Tax=Micromonospora purpureochromogenes TaxID=47872 RepID=UPI0012FDAC58|nr:FxSxx-COOH cyclophane-containing RiPP peptide [Micromonospora purpureochromogenes]
MVSSTVDVDRPSTAYGGTDVDRIAVRPDPTPTPSPPPLDDLRHTPLGQISLSRASAVARVHDRRVDRPTGVDVAGFGSSI